MKQPPLGVQLFTFNLLTIGGWGQSATALRDAAKALFGHYYGLQRLMIDPKNDPPDSQTKAVGRVILMLAGLAIENLAKGLWILENGGTLISGQLPEELMTHIKTNRFLKDAKVSLTDRERALVTKLKPFVVWEGKYPVPTTVKKLTFNVFQTDDFDRFTKLFDRLKALLDERLKVALSKTDA